nr:hypothetical protein [Tanacetum cinerariifolium]
MNATDGSGYAKGLVLVFSGLSFSSFTLFVGSSLWESLCCLGWIVMVLIEPSIWVDHYGSSVGIEPLGVTKMVLLGLKSVPLTSRFVASEQDELPSNFELILELDEVAVGCTRDILGKRDFLNRLSAIPWVVLTFVVIEGEPKVDAMMRDFLDPSWWKESSKETSSKILPCGDGSGWKMFKLVASLIAKGKLK